MKTFTHFAALTLIVLFMSMATGMAQKQKVILDTDIGSDIDDAFAVALLLTSPEFEVLGIVTDYGNTPKRANIVCKMLHETGNEDIPVVVGEKTDDHYDTQFHWAEGFDKVTPIEQSGSDFIIEKLEQHPDEIVLFTIGPVTNIGNVVEKNPDALKKAKHIYSMFGSFYMGYGRHPVPSAEWNVRADVDASQKMASAGADITYAGLDVTTFVKLEEDRRLELLMRQSPLTDALSGLYTLWPYETPTLYDPVAIGMLLWPELFNTRKAHVDVTEEGYTVIDESKEPNAEIGMSINKEEFLDRVMERLLQQNMNESD
ncbi:MAG: nucleoside hydrolase [Bacteroidales bacterium]|nr:nucleoside hydrolase [Bacteroidales bacterium]